MSLDKGLGESEYKDEAWASLKDLKSIPAPSVDDDERMAELGKKFDLPEVRDKEFLH